MANNNTTPSRLGQLQATGDARSTFLTLWSGEIMRTYDTLCVTQGKIHTRTIPHGKTATFPKIGRASAFRHTAGTNIFDAGNSLLNTIKHGQKTINIDDKLIAPAFIADVDEIMNHYDVRSPYTKALAFALAKSNDQRVLRLMGLAARANTTITGTAPDSLLLGESWLNGTTPSTVAALKSDSLSQTAPTYAALIAAARAAATVLDQKDIPETERYWYVTPAQYYALIENSGAGTDILSRDFNGANGSMAAGKVYSAFGLQIVKTNHMPSTNFTTETAGDGTDGVFNIYGGDFRKTAGLVCHWGAVGELKLRDMAFEMEYDMDVQGTKMLAKILNGYGIIEPACAVELTTVNNNA